MEKDYTALLDELREGTLDKLEINTEEFMDFQKAFILTDRHIGKSGIIEKITEYSWNS